MREKSAIPINQEEISVYLKDVRKLKVMTPERERELSRRMLSNEISDEEKVQYSDKHNEDVQRYENEK